MDSAPHYVTVETLTRIVFPTMYTLAGFAVYRWLLPDLSLVARRLASVMLVAQALVISKTLFVEPSSSLDVWLWQLHQEWNVPATLAATQLALVGCIALVSAWLCRTRMLLQRLYLFGIAWYSYSWPTMNTSRCMNIGPDGTITYFSAWLLWQQRWLWLRSRRGGPGNGTFACWQA